MHLLGKFYTTFIGFKTQIGKMNSSINQQGKDQYDEQEDDEHKGKTRGKDKKKRKGRTKKTDEEKSKFEAKKRARNHAKANAAQARFLGFFKAAAAEDIVNDDGVGGSDGSDGEARIEPPNDALSKNAPSNNAGDEPPNDAGRAHDSELQQHDTPGHTSCVNNQQYTNGDFDDAPTVVEHQDVFVGGEDNAEGDIGNSEFDNNTADCTSGPAENVTSGAYSDWYDTSVMSQYLKAIHNRLKAEVTTRVSHTGLCDKWLLLMSFICASVINHDITKVMGQ
jgi:hypothetical protein